MRIRLVVASMLFAAPAAAQTPMERRLYSFDGVTSSFPAGPLVMDKVGNLYGTTNGTGPDASFVPVVYKLSPPAPGQRSLTMTVLRSFRACPSDCGGPAPGLLLDAAGNLLGTTPSGGLNSDGAVFMLSPPPAGQTEWTETILHSFTGADGRSPDGLLVADKTGKLYGTTRDDAALATVFTLTPPAVGLGAWQFHTIYTFGATLGSIFESPQPGLLLDQSGELYGATDGGTTNDGSIFRLSPPAAGQTTWSEDTLYTFQGGTSDGVEPNGELIRDKAGDLLGTTQYGGSVGAGTVFKLRPPVPGQTAWSETLLHSFDVRVDGYRPSSGLTVARGGTVYGTTQGDGGVGDLARYGSVFSLKPPAPGQTSGTETVYLFKSLKSGYSPEGTLISSGKGSLIGVTQLGGSLENAGTVFEIRD